MKKPLFAHFRARSLICSLAVLLGTPSLMAGEASSAAISAFNAYNRAVEARITEQHRSRDTFLAFTVSDPRDAEQRLRHGELIIERLTPPRETEVPGALLHHWRGTAFAPKARAADLERLLRDFRAYPQVFSPEVLQARDLAQGDDRMQAWMRVRQRHVIPVVLDTAYDVSFGRLDAQHGYSISKSTHIAEIESPGTSAERALGPDEEHGFLWRLNTYWSYEERDGGLYLQVESVSLTRSIPRSLSWVIRPYVDSIPRDSLEFTLRSARNALRR